MEAKYKYDISTRANNIAGCPMIDLNIKFDP